MLQRERKDSPLVFLFLQNLLVDFVVFGRDAREMFPTTPLKPTFECIGRGCMHCRQKMFCLSVCLFSAVAAACRVSGNLIATFLVVLPLIFMARLNFPRKIYSGRQSQTITKKFYFSRHKRRERII